MSELFVNYANFILFVHVFAALFWVGGMLAIRLAVHPALQHIEDPKVRLARTLEILKYFFSYVVFMIILLLASAIIMAVGLGFKGTPLYSVVLVKEGIWTIMTVVFTIIYIRRNQAEKLFISGDLAGAKQKLAPIATYLIPINIALGIAALYFGGVLRGF